MAGIFALYLLSRLPMLAKVPVFFDESIYIRWSQELLRDCKFLVSLTDGKPPLHVWWMAPFVRLAGDPLLAGRLASVFAGGLTTGGMFLLGREISGWKLGAWGSLLYVVCPFALWYDRVAMAEGLLLATFVFAAWLAVRAAGTPQFRRSVPLGMVIGLALLTKGTAGLLFPLLPFAFLAVRSPATGGRERTGEDGVTGRGSRRPIVRWAAVLGVSYIIGYGLYSLLRLSAKFPLIALRTSATTRGAGEVLRDPFDVFFSNLGAIWGTLVVFLTPLLFALAIAGIAFGLARRWKPAGFLVAWVLVVVVVESLVARHWMFDTILPRFFLPVVPPLLIAGGYLCELAGERLRGWRPGRRAVRPAVAVAMVAALLALPVLTDAMVLASPARAVLPEWIRVQYLTDWPSGWGIRESARFLEEKSGEGPVVVGSNLNGIGLPTDGLEMYLEGTRGVEVIPFNYAETDFPVELAGAARSRNAYLVYNSFPGRARPPGNWPLELVERFPKDGNEGQALYLFRVVGEI